MILMSGAGQAKARDAVAAIACMLAFSCAFAAAAQCGLSYEYYSKYNASVGGEIAAITVDPAKPLVMEDTTATVGARNPQNRQNDYLLKIVVSRAGRVVEESDFTFSLNAGKELSVSFPFSPTGIGGHSVVAKLYDKYGTVLHSEKVLDFVVSSEVGPFDVQLDVLSRNIRPGYDIPMMLTLKNMGTSGTDVQVAVSMECGSQGSVYKDLFVYVGGAGSLDKSLSLPACNEEGQHEVSAKIVMFGGTLAQSTSSVFINSTQRPAQLRAPKYIEAAKGTSKVFDIYVRNDDGEDVNNVRVMLNGVPAGWISVEPKSVPSIAPNGSAMFLVNVSVPPDAEAAEYPFTVSLGGDEVLAQQESVLSVIGAAGALPAVASGGYGQYDALRLAAAVVIVAAAAFWLSRKRQASVSRKVILMKVKDMVRANE